MKRFLFAVSILAAGAAQAGTAQCPAGTKTRVACQVSTGLAFAVCESYGAVKVFSNSDSFKVTNVEAPRTDGRFQVTRLTTSAGIVDVRTFYVAAGKKSSGSPAEVVIGGITKSASCSVDKTPEGHLDVFPGQSGNGIPLSGAVSAPAARFPSQR